LNACSNVAFFLPSLPSYVNSYADDVEGDDDVDGDDGDDGEELGGGGVVSDEARAGPSRPVGACSTGTSLGAATGPVREGHLVGYRMVTTSRCKQQGM